MFETKNILKHTKILLILLIFHFLITTFIKFQLGHDLQIEFLQTNLINLWKDFYLIFIYFLIIINILKNKTKLNKKLLIFFSILLIFSIIISLINFTSIKTIILWIKYDIWFLFPILFFAHLNLKEKDLKKIYNLLLFLIKTILIFSLLFAIVRFLWPNMLYLLWYWPLWDWAPNVHPPKLFQTWLNWVNRFFGIFSGPNHMAFYLIAFWPVLFLSIINKKSHFIRWILYLILLFGSLSRSWIIALFAEIFLLSIYIFAYQKSFRKIIINLFIFWFVWVLILSIYLRTSWKYNEVILRWSSTAWHIKKSFTTIEKIAQKPMWYWLWTAGPSAHYLENMIIPESWILQIFYEIWFLWWIIWFWFTFYYIYQVYKSKTKNYDEINKINILKIWLSIWFIWLLIQGLFLHSFEDSMISLPFFIIIWLLLTNTQEKKIN